jgi:nucleoside diphosphate kinase
MAKVLAQITVKLPRLMEAGEYRKLRYAGGKPSLQQLTKWIEDGEVVGEVKGGMYFVDVQAAVMGTTDPLLAQMMEIG